MDILKTYFPNFFDIFHITFLFVFSYYGWVLFVIGLIYILYRMYRAEIEHQYVNSIKWTFLQIKVPRQNSISTLAMENIFAQMHSLHTGLTPAQIYLEGRIQSWYSLEIVSFGGKVSFILRIPSTMRHVVEAAFYANYPQVEIYEVSDYLENFSYDPANPKGLELWGTEWKLTEPDVFPIKTYKEFEHPTAEEKILDPLGPFFESLGKIEPHEFFATQIIIQPLADDEWKPRSQRKIKELIGEEVPHEISLMGLLLAPFEWFAKFSYKEFFFGGHGHGHDEGNLQKNNWMSMTEGEKEQVGFVEAKMSKPGYKTKIREIYIAPKDKFDATKKSMFTGAYRLLSHVRSNKLKPDVSKTWTAVDYIFSPTLEKGYLDWRLAQKKRNVFKGFKKRDIHIGNPMPVLNIEELATIFHFPITGETGFAPASIEKTESKKSQAPANLPVLE